MVKDFQTRDSVKVLKYSADLGHYIGDAHVPLQTNSNNNGQLNNQIGIHAFWESLLPENYSLLITVLLWARQITLKTPLKEAWKIIKRIHSLIDNVLSFEKELSVSIPSDKKYSFAERNNTVLKQYSLTYLKAYPDKMNNMIEKSMRSAILEIGSFWYSAWNDAGHPEFKKPELNWR